MKCILSILLFGLVSQFPVWSQERIEFNIFFIGAQPAHNPLLPPGGGVLIADAFSPIVYLEDVSPTSGQIVELGDDNLFHAISPLNTVFAGYYSSENGNLGTAYSLEKTLSLSESQIQNLLAGKWYVEVLLGQNTYFGRFTPVPEPSGLALLTSGTVLLLMYRLKGRAVKVLNHCPGSTLPRSQTFTGSLSSE